MQVLADLCRTERERGKLAGMPLANDVLETFMYLERGFCGDYDHHVFETLVFRPRYRLMHCRKWQSKPCWETPEPPKRPTMPWQFAANFRTGWGYSSPYSMKRLGADQLEPKRGAYRRDIYRARMDPLRGYVSETVKKPKPGTRTCFATP